MALVQGVDVPAVIVSDMERARSFYCDLLGMTAVEVKGADSSWSAEEQARWHAYHELCVGLPGARIQAVFLQAPDGTHLELIEYLQPDLPPPPRRSPAEPGSAVIPFAIEDSATAVAKLRAAGIEILGGPVPYVLDGVTTNTTYLYDPDGNILCLFEVVSGTYTIGDKDQPS
jgi:catechol 2,3-dioxygenase-like lactoylglutathione lyase family enzyme